jgi:hypothetical protein
MLQLAGHPGAEVLDHHVGAAHQVVNTARPASLLRSNSDALLVAVERDEVGALAVQGIVRVRGQQLARALPLAAAPP